MDPIGTALHALDRAAADMRERPVRELDRLHTLAVDIALKARQWNPRDPQRTAELICETAMDELYEAPAWNFLIAAVRAEFAEPLPAVKSMLAASLDWLRIAALTAEDAGA